MLRALYRCATITAKTLIILIRRLFLAHKLLTNPTYLFKQKIWIAYVQGLIEITFDWTKIDYLELKKAELLVADDGGNTINWFKHLIDASSSGIFFIKTRDFFPAGIDHHHWDRCQVPTWDVIDGNTRL